MLVGQTLALRYLDPATLPHGGVVVAREVLIRRLAERIGTESFVRPLNPRRKRFAAQALR